jgi:hypothetical protein
VNKFLPYALAAALIPAAAFAQAGGEVPSEPAHGASYPSSASGQAPEAGLPDPAHKISEPKTLEADDSIMLAPVPIPASHPQIKPGGGDSRSEYSMAARSYDGYGGGFSFSGFQLGAGLGLLGGANFMLGYRIPYNPDNFWKNRLAFRVEYNTAKPFESAVEKEEIEIDDEKFTPHIRGKQFGALVDFYPFGYTWLIGGFRLSGGYYTGDFAIGASMHKEASGTFSMKNQNGVELYYKAIAAADLVADLEYEKLRGPYAGAGFDLGLFWGLKFYFDAGVVFTEKPGVSADIKASGNIDICTNDTYSSCSGNYTVNSVEIQSLLNDTVREYEHELDSIRKGYFPIVKLGLLFRF